MYTVEELYNQHGRALGLKLVTQEMDLKRAIIYPEANRPGLCLLGYLSHFAKKRVLVFGKAEIDYLKSLSFEKGMISLSQLCDNKETPAIIIARRFRVPSIILATCEKFHIPLFRSTLPTPSLISKLTLLLINELGPNVNCHGTLVEVFGIGMLIQGDSSVGKSEAALGLIEKGHRLISDDLVKIKKREGNYLEGFGFELTKHHMEIRGIGIINIAHLYGAVCVRDNKSIDIVVKLEAWNDQHFYDRIGTDEKFCEILGITVPFHTLPVKPGRDVVLLLETIALTHRLKTMGYDSAREFKKKVLKRTAGSYKGKKLQKELLSS